MITIVQGVQRQLLSWADAARPAEACGLLFGEWDGADGLLDQAALCRNGAVAGRFTIPADTLLAHADDPRWVGVWHSHPVGPARLSERDRRAAQAWPRLAHLLVVPPADLLLFAPAAQGLMPLPWSQQRGPKVYCATRS